MSALLRRSARPRPPVLHDRTTSDPLDGDAPAALRLVDVHKSYAQGTDLVPALRGVDLVLPAGSFTAVMGPSGSGKSTFLNCAAGLDTPTSGTIHVGGVDLTGRSADDLTIFRRDHIGFVFQAYNLVPQLSVEQNIQLPLLLAGRPVDDTRQEALLEAVGLGGMAPRMPGELSGGQAQRVAIARALMTSPEILFADEPTGALDSRTGRQIIQLLRDASQQTGQTVVLVTHDPVIAAVADRVLFLADGVLVGHLTAPTATEVASRMTELGGH